MKTLPTQKVSAATGWRGRRRAAEEESELRSD
jgi:hypothetical protein